MNTENNGTCKSTKRERRKKFAKFKTTMHNLFGPIKANGIGEGKPIVCDICKKRVYKATYKDGKWTCTNC